MRAVEKGVRLGDPYVTAGDRLYAIGSQDGRFPAIGSHIDGEMGGIWAHPHKVADGFWLTVRVGDRSPRPVVFERFCTRASESRFFHRDAAEGWTLERRDWVPDGLPVLVCESTITNPSDHPLVLTVGVTVRSNLRPGWLAQAERGRDEAIAGPDGVEFLNRVLHLRAAVGADVPDAQWLVEDGEGEDPRVTAGFFATRTLPPGEAWTLRWWIATETSDLPLARVLGAVRTGADRDALRAAKVGRLRQVMQRSDLLVPDPAIAHAFVWAKVGVDWLVREVAGIGRGLGAGLPEYPWWFGCDSAWALKGALATGRFGLARATVELLAQTSQTTNGNGRIIHELSTTGVVYHPGNMQESAQFAELVWDVFRWTGDRDFLNRMLPRAEAAVAFVLEAARDGDDLPYGYGIIEVADLDLKCIDTAVHTAQALRALASLHEAAGNGERVRTLTARARRLEETIRRVYFRPQEGLFGDFWGPSEAMAERVRTFARRAEQEGRSDVAEAMAAALRAGAGGAINLGNWVINTPLAAGIAEAGEARAALARMRREDFRGPHGLYLSGFYRTHMMTISTGVQAVAEARYGYADEALDWMWRMARTMDWRTPGAMAEMSPDGGCFVQAWSLYGLAVPVVEHFFGVMPKAHARFARVGGIMPTAWPWAELKNLRIGDNHVDLALERDRDGDVLSVQTRRPWRFAFPEGSEPLSARDARRTAGAIWDLGAGGAVTVRLPRGAPNPVGSHAS